MSSVYPGTIDTFVNPAGTSSVLTVDHAGQHTNANDSLKIIEQTLGTNSGTSVLKQFTVGQFAARVDSNNSFLDSNNNEVFKSVATPSAVNEVTLTNAGTGNAVQIAATGDDTNIDLTISPKGTGVLRLTNSAKMRAYTSSAQAIPNTTATKVQLDTKDYDPGSKYDGTTNYRYTVPVAGYYQIHGQVTFAVNGTGERVARLYKNGTEVVYKTVAPNSGAFTSVDITDTWQLAASDYVELYCTQTSGGTLALGNAGSQRNWMDIHLLSV